MNDPAPPQEAITIPSAGAPRWVATACVVLAVGAGLVYTLVVPPVWQATTTILVPAGGQGGGVSSIAQQLGVNLAGGKDGSSLTMYEAILSSERAVSIVAKRTSLSNRKLRGAREVRADSKTNLITLEVRHESPDRAIAISKDFVHALSEINRALKVPGAKNRGDFLRIQIEQKAARVNQIEEDVQSFLQKAKTLPDFAPGGQLGPMVVVSPQYQQQLVEVRVDLQRVRESLRSLRAKIIESSGVATDLPTDLPPAKIWRPKLQELELNLKNAEISGGPDDPKVRFLKRQIAVAKTEFQREVDRYLASIKAETIDPSPSTNNPQLGNLEVQKVSLEAQELALADLAAAAPGEAKNYARLIRELATQSSVLNGLRVDYEQTKIDEQNDPNRWEVLDPPYVGDRPINKSLLKNGAIAFVAGVFLAALLSAFLGTRHPNS